MRTLFLVLATSATVFAFGITEVAAGDVSLMYPRRRVFRWCGRSKQGGVSVSPGHLTSI
jgi:hypothetical protein